MKANTYVVKPFGISEVKVIALKGDPGTPTQEQVNTAVDEYMTEHPEAQIPDGSITEQKLSSDVVATLNDVDNKADKVGSYPDLVAGTADNLLSSSYQTDKTPYILRRTPYGARERGSIVGGSIVWNQLVYSYEATGGTVTESDGIVTITPSASGNRYRANGNGVNGIGVVLNHIYLQSVVIKSDGSHQVGFQNFANPGALDCDDKTNSANWTTLSQVQKATASGICYVQLKGATGFDYQIKKNSFMIFDLTLMFGSTIADYIYAQEQATAGAGIALAKAWAGITADYYPYDPGSIKSVTGLTAHKMTGFNQWDEEWEVGSINVNTGEKTVSEVLHRSKNPIPIVQGMNYYLKFWYSLGSQGVRLCFYDSNNNFIRGFTKWSENLTAAEIPSGTKYMLWGATAIRATYNNDICINLSDPAKNGTYEPYTAHEYPLDSSLTLRGLLKLDGDNLYYDGDIYKADGTVERRYGVRAYQSGDESDANVLTDGTNTVYKLATPTTEQAEPYTELQICDPAGTEEWVGANMPVGHDTKYYADLKGKIEDIPDAPSANGTYVLKATVSSSGVTYAWIAG